MAVLNDEEAATHLLEGDETHPDAPVEDDAGHMTEFEDDDSLPTPRFLQDLGAYRKWRWVPPSCRRMWKTVKTWAKGPQPPQIQVVIPLFPDIQEAPIRLLDMYLLKRKQRLALLLAFYFCWMLTFGLVFRQGTFATDMEGYGKPADIGCGNTFWGPGNSCGLDGVNCRPFYNSSFAFRCPGECRKLQVLNNRAVGAQEIIYRPLVIGGPPEDEPEGKAIYRGDSFICSAAIHAGIIDNSIGGCGVVSLAGEQRHYDSTDRHGITSIAFDSYFPLSFSFSSATSCEAKDMRWALLAVSMVFTILLSLFTSSPGVFFWSIYIGIYVHVGFASDPPPYDSVASLFSNLLGKFLPGTFCAFVIYRYCAIKTLKNLRAQVEKTVLWVGGCWFGALSNITLDWIPIQRLTSHDLEQQPGAKLALAIIVILLSCIVVQQVYNFRLEGRLLRYLALYGTFVGTLLLSLLLPDLNLRIHHYILALLLLPGTSMQTRPVLFYQGLLMGFFINGVARWGFDPVLETSAALQGDAPYYSELPTPLQPLIALGTAVSNISFNWDFPPLPFDGFSVLVNDVERFRGFVDEGYGAGREWVWSREPGLAEPEYFRFGFMEGNVNWDYSRAGIWNPDGSWVEMEDGPSRVRSRAALGEDWTDR